MPSIKPITLTVKTENRISILHSLKGAMHLAGERAIDLALKKSFDER